VHKISHSAVEQARSIKVKEQNCQKQYKFKSVYDHKFM